MSLSLIYPEKLMLGMEIRIKVTEYVRQKIVALRESKTHENVSVMRMNAMKFLPNFFEKGQVINSFPFYIIGHYINHSF
jgi:tRNA (guanine-N7-)-methyltransferase